MVNGKKKVTFRKLSIQPMSNLFEQMSWLVYDSIIMTLMDDLNQTAEEMMARHTNLE